MNFVMGNKWNEFSILQDQLQMSIPVCACVRGCSCRIVCHHSLNMSLCANCVVERDCDFCVCVGELECSICVSSFAPGVSTCLCPVPEQVVCTCAISIIV